MRIRTQPALLALALVLAFAALFAPTASADRSDLDATFGTNGVSSLWVDGFITLPATTIATQADGKIVAAGRVWVSDYVQRTYIKRYLPNGTLDTSFGTAGTVLFASTKSSSPGRLVIEDDQKILLAGDYAGHGDKQPLIRLNSNGSIDSEDVIKPTDGSVFSDFVILKSGDIITAGAKYDGAKWNLQVHRYDPSGNPRTTYDANVAAATATYGPVVLLGNVRVLLSEDESEIAVALKSPSDEFAAWKFDDSGMPVDSWGAHGVATAAASIHGMEDAVMRNGAITFVGGNVYPVIGALDATGHTPPGYGDNGSGMTTIKSLPGQPENNLYGNALRVRLTPDGRTLILIGSSDVSPDRSVKGYTSTAMFTSLGKLDPTYGTNGIVTYKALGKNPGTLELLSFGKALIAGYPRVPDDPTPVLARVYGTLDPPDTRSFDPTVRGRILSPGSGRLTAKKFKKLTGTAGPTGQVTKVEVALQRVNTRLLKKQRRCLWLNDSSGRFTRFVAKANSCASPKWIEASGTGSWRYDLKHRLPKGDYVVRVRFTRADGTVQPSLNHRRFKLT